MTTIAFDGKFLAADSGCTWGGCLLQVAESKLAIREALLFAGTGRETDWRALLEWYAGPRLKDDFPRSIDESVCLFALSQTDWRARYVNDNGHSTVVMAPYANGSGQEIAMGAMLAGASAVEAVRIACRVDKNTRGPIDYVRIDALPWVIETIAVQDTLTVRRQGEEEAPIRRQPLGANGGIAPRPLHEGQA